MFTSFLGVGHDDVDVLLVGRLVAMLFLLAGVVPVLGLAALGVAGNIHPVGRRHSDSAG